MIIYIYILLSVSDGILYSESPSLWKNKWSRAKLDLPAKKQLIFSPEKPLWYETIWFERWEVQAIQAIQANQANQTNPA